MSGIIIIVAFSIGIILGIAVSFLLKIIQTKTGKDLANELFQESEILRKQNIDAVIENVKATFGNLSLDALAKSTEEFLKLAKSKLDSEREMNLKELDTKKGLIDQQLQRMNTELDGISKVVQDLEKDRVEKFGALSRELKNTSEQTNALMQTTNSLREALAHSKIRGLWGERMAEDILRLAGFIENVNYLKQKTIEGGSARPDFTFLLPRELKLNMDVKFPLDNYIKYINAKTDMEKEKHCADFLKDVRLKMKEVTSREYIDPGQKTVDYALLFIPNEQIYSFIHEQDNSILDEGIKNRVVFCSPLTLYAILAVIRQAVDNFSLEQTSNEILSLLGAFKKQWGDFIKRFEVLGEKIEGARSEYESLVTTRKRQLEKPLNKIDALRSQKGLPIPSEEKEPISIDEGGN